VVTRLIDDSYVGALQYIRDLGADYKDVAVPVVEIRTTEWDSLEQELGNNMSFLVRLNSSDINPWVVFKDGPFILVSWKIFISSFCIINILLACYKLFEFQYNKTASKIAIITLCCEIIGNSIRLSLTAVDPWAARIIYTSQTKEILYTITIPISLCTDILIALYVHEALNSASLAVVTFLTQYKIIFYLFVPLVFTIELTTSSLRAFTTFSSATNISGVFYFVVILGVIIYYTYVSIAMFAALKKRASIGFQQEIAIRLVVRMLFSGVGLIIMETSSILVLTNFFYSPFGESFTLWLGYFGLSFNSFIQIICFQGRSGSNPSSNLTNTDGSAKFTDEVKPHLAESTSSNKEWSLVKD